MKSCIILQKKLSVQLQNMDGRKISRMPFKIGKIFFSEWTNFLDLDIQTIKAFDIFCNFW